MIFIEATSWRSYPRCARVGGVSGTLLAGGYGKMEVDPGIVIHLCRRGKVELIKRNILMALVEDKEGGPSEQVIVNLLGGTAVREDKGDGFLSGGNWRCFRLTWRRLVGIWRQIRRHILRRRWTIVGLRCGGRCAPGVITGVIRRKRIAKVTGVSHKAIGQAGSIR